MAKGPLAFLMKVGLVSDEMVPPRKVTGFPRILLSIVAVAYSSFFIYVAFFGSPAPQYFKGTFLLGVTILSLILYKSRRKPMRDGFVWLDEFFAVANLVVLCGSIGIWARWQFVHQAEVWHDFTDGRTWVFAGIGGLIGLALYVSEATRAKVTDNLTISDVLYLLGAAASILWWMDSLTILTERIGGPVPTQVVFFSGMLVAASFEIARRIVGPIIPLIGFLFFVYSFEPVAQSMPGLLLHAGLSVDRVMEFLLMSSDGMTGIIIEVFATYIVIFVILGAFLEKTGLGSLIIDATYRLTGQRTGGPGLAAVTSSGLFGMISGSPVANVVTTGTFTIPLMKRVGYRPEFAGAVEAAASTGGAYMPPIMGAGAFLLAELTETSYFTVVKIAAVPALLYYLSVGLIVYLRAARYGLHGVSASELPPLSRIAPRLHLLLPIPAMVYFLVIGDSPFLAAGKTIALIVMLRAVDLLVAIRTPRADSAWKPYLAVSVVFGAFVYFFGLDVGPPFSWFAPDYRGITIGGAMFWAIGMFIVLKLGEILVSSNSARMTAVPQAGLAADAPPEDAREGARRCLSRIASELIRNIWAALEGGARNTLLVGCIAGVLGILLSSATQSDLPGRVSNLLVEWSFGLLPVTICWVILAGLVVGMGLPITASYVILAIFAVGALTQLGVAVMTAHMISYWLAVVSAVTPPVALAAYAASAISGGDPVKTGIQASKIASMIFIMPVMFIYTPILLDGSTFDITVTVVGAVLGVIAWAIFLEQFAFRATTTLEWALSGVAAVLILLPVDRMINYFLGVEQKLFYETYFGGAIILGGVITSQLMRRRTGETVAVPGE